MALFFLILFSVSWGEDVALEVERARMVQKHEDFLAHKLSKDIRERIRIQAAAEMESARVKQGAEREKARAEFIRSGARQRSSVDAEKAEQEMNSIRRARDEEWNKSAKGHSTKKEIYLKALRSQKKISDLDEVGLGEDYFSEREAE